jgi:hypothetical protein
LLDNVGPAPEANNDGNDDRNANRKRRNVDESVVASAPVVSGKLEGVQREMETFLVYKAPDNSSVTARDELVNYFQACKGLSGVVDKLRQVGGGKWRFFDSFRLFFSFFFFFFSSLFFARINS